MTNLAAEPPGSVASTNAKAALFLRLTTWASIVCGLAFLFCVVTPGKDGLADNILWAFLLFLCALGGINMVQRKFDRDSDWGLEERKRGYPIDGRVPGAAPTVTKETTITTEKATKETVAPAVAPAVPVVDQATGTTHDPGA